MQVEIGTKVVLDNQLPLVCVAGPCAIESIEHALDTANKLKRITQNLGMPFIYKSSFDKANRSSIKSFRGPGIDEGLEILAEVRRVCSVPVMTDIHIPDQARKVAAIVDMLQIPAFLCRQTDLVLAAAETGKPINIKKGQFVAPMEMRAIIDKAASVGNPDICLCERGSFFGYHDLVVDMRSLEIMKSMDHPVIFDATHSVQHPGGQGARSGGKREYVFPLARAATAIGVAAVFMETHEDPDAAPCDGPNMVPLSELPAILKTLQTIDKQVKAIK